MIINKNGFTLIELLVIISILGFVAANLVISVNRVRALANDTRRIADMTQIIKAMDFFYNDKGRYPSLCGTYTGECVGDQNMQGQDINKISPCGDEGEFEMLAGGSLGKYLANVPHDPKHNRSCGVMAGMAWGTCGNSSSDYFYSYDPQHWCGTLNPGSNNCATLCFNRAETEKYTCAKTNPVCGGSDNDMGQKNAAYCYVFKL